MRRFTVEFVRPCSLERSPDAELTFRSIWARLPGMPPGWRSRSLLPEDGGLFLKGTRLPPLSRKRQIWRRRWDVHREMANLRRLAGLGLPVTTPVAWGCEARFGIPLRSFLMLRACAGTLNLSEFIRATGPEARRLAVFRAVGTMIASVHAAGVRHGDLACRNVLVRCTGAEPEALLVDFARTRFVAPGARADRLRRTDLYRLAKTAFRQGAGDREVAAMLGAAAGPEAPRIIEATRAIRAIGARPVRKLRIQLWRLFGS